MSKSNKDEYEIKSYIQHLHGGRKRVVVDLFKIKKEKVKSWYLDFED